MHIWLRDEARVTERRAPLVPADAGRLIGAGARITVERSEKRVFTDTQYADAGCSLAPPGGWTGAPEDALILGVKELPDAPETLTGRFAHFAHLYKDQRGWREQMARFGRGGATLYDLEYLTDEQGRRVAAFGYWAGWIGAALGIWGWLVERRGLAGRPPFGGVEAQQMRDAFIQPVRTFLKAADRPPRVLIVGALGRAGNGAQAFCNALGLQPTKWDLPEVLGLRRDRLLAHDILVNCALIQRPGTVLAMQGHITMPGVELSMIADVACDPLSDLNPLPFYDAPTSWEQPFRLVARRADGQAVHVMAIDNLPSLLPLDASRDFSAQLAPVLAQYPDGVTWRNAEGAFREARSRIEGGTDA